MRLVKHAISIHLMDLPTVLSTFRASLEHMPRFRMHLPVVLFRILRISFPSLNFIRPVTASRRVLHESPHTEFINFETECVIVRVWSGDSSHMFMLTKWLTQHMSDMVPVSC